MFVVLVAGVAIAAKGIALPVESPPPQNIISPPIYTQPASFQKTTSLQLNSGSLAELIQSEAETEIRDYSSGTRYRVGGGKVIGSDGSRFQVVGSTIIGDRGYTLQVVGNNVFTSDGRRCSKISSLLTCK